MFLNMECVIYECSCLYKISILTVYSICFLFLSLAFIVGLMRAESDGEQSMESGSDANLHRLAHNFNFVFLNGLKTLERQFKNTVAYFNDTECVFN